jgi:hypothetical protein
MTKVDNSKSLIHALEIKRHTCTKRVREEEQIEERIVVKRSKNMIELCPNINIIFEYCNTFVKLYSHIEDDVISASFVLLDIMKIDFLILCNNNMVSSNDVFTEEQIEAVFDPKYRDITKYTYDIFNNLKFTVEERYSAATMIFYKPTLLYTYYKLVNRNNDLVDYAIYDGIYVLTCGEESATEHSFINDFNESYKQFINQTNKCDCSNLLSQLKDANDRIANLERLVKRLIDK